MKNNIHDGLIKASLSLLLIIGTSFIGYTQHSFGERLTWSVKFTLQGYNIPFKNKNFSLKNMGAALGVDYSYNASGSLFQTLSLGMFHNKEHGNNYYVNTQVTYRSLVLSRMEPGISLGIGRILSYANKSYPYHDFKDGSWSKSRVQSISRWQVPFSLNLGYNIGGPNGNTITPFIDYESAAIINYNSAFPVLPYTLLGVGSRIQFKTTKP